MSQSDLTLVTMSHTTNEESPPEEQTSLMVPEETSSTTTAPQIKESPALGSNEAIDTEQTYQHLIQEMGPYSAQHEDTGDNIFEYSSLEQSCKEETIQSSLSNEHQENDNDIAANKTDHLCNRSEKSVSDSNENATENENGGTKPPSDHEEQSFNVLKAEAVCVSYQKVDKETEAEDKLSLNVKTLPRSGPTDDETRHTTKPYGSSAINENTQTRIKSMFPKLPSAPRPSDDTSADVKNSVTALAEGLGQNEVVVVTGGCGFLGQHIVKMLQLHAPQVAEVRVLDQQPFQRKLDYQAQKPVKSVVGSVTDAGVVQMALRGAHCVMHVAGLVSYGTHPDFEGMDSVNSTGTNIVLEGCLQQNVQRFIYCSTVDVVVGQSPIRDGDEEMPRVPDKFLFPGYPESKYRGERLVQKVADTRRRQDGGKLQTATFRANVMYGELDPFYVTSGLRAACKAGGVLHQVGDGKAMFQQCYVGNTAWAFVCADVAMRLDTTLSAEIFYVPDDTPIQNSFNFMRPYLEARGYRLSDRRTPYSITYAALAVGETVCKLLRPLAKFSLPSQSYSVRYINTDIWFKGSKARQRLRFQPLFAPHEARALSMTYYKTVNLENE